MTTPAPSRFRETFASLAPLHLCVALAAWVGPRCSSEKPPQPSFQFVCEEGALCECSSNEQCPDGSLCLNGQCVGGEKPDVSLAETQAPPGVDLLPDGAIPPGAFMSPCLSDADCDSGICLETSPGAKLCSMECVDECPGGWECRGVTGEDEQVYFFCFPKQDRLCQPCKTDVSCTGGGNLCVVVGGVPSCTRDCTVYPCPSGYSCQEVSSVEGKQGMQCVPDSGHCQCNLENVGKVFQCFEKNEFGECPGQQVCLDGATLGACDALTPAAETCDGKDNDCDGFSDEGIPSEPCTKENEFGLCVGSVVCLSGGSEACNAAIPAEESCDHLDNDCDGGVDEDFRNEYGIYHLLEHCGNCGNKCEGKFAHASSVSCDISGDEPMCKVDLCEPGFIVSSEGLCLPAIHHLCEPCTSDAACVGAGDKCLSMNPNDPLTFCGRDCSPGNAYQLDCPEGYSCQSVVLEGKDFQQCVPSNGTCDCFELTAGMVKPCTVTNEYGSCFGVSSCDPVLGWTGCTALTPDEEVCDGFDNNCNGIIDENLGGVACSAANQWGECVGIQVCIGEDGLLCNAHTPAQELCDGKDNDCDGAIDDPFATNLTDEEGKVVDVIYDLTNENCGGCGIACKANPPASKAECSSQGGAAKCEVIECLPGYYLAGGKTCLAVPSANLCLSCAKNADCLGPEDKCLNYPEGKRCGRDCSEGSIYSTGQPGDAGWCTPVEGDQGCCPDGFLCKKGQCVRASASCECDKDGKVRPCASDNMYGACPGVETCVTSGPNAGWSECDAATPAQEVCDGLDNDCDGLLDGFDPSVDTSGLAGFPDCQNVSEACKGVWTCLLAGGKHQWVCSAKTPVLEKCNGMDDDCDGKTDEDFKTPDGEFLLVDHCGVCGLGCLDALSNLATDQQGVVLPGAAACELVAGKPVCVPKKCAAGHYLFPQGPTPSTCMALKHADCQPCSQDVDCPGIGSACVVIPDDAALRCSARCDSGSPFPGCAGKEGTQDCCLAGYVCSTVDGEPAGQKFCLPASKSCQCNEGNQGMARPCATKAGDGTECIGWSTCALEQSGLWKWGKCDTSDNVEVCDEKDNDCNGAIDDGFQVNGKYASDANCGGCGNNCLLAWSKAEQHAKGVCNPNFPAGPGCVIGSCLMESVGGGRFCASDADCAKDLAGPTCLSGYFQCGKACTKLSDCPPGSACTGGWCAPPCTADAQCTAAFGPASRCNGGYCSTTWQFKDTDGWTGNGCECPSAVDLLLDEPDVFPSYPLPGAVYADRDCDGIDGDLESALFVSADSLGGDGSLGAPYPTIKQAIDAFNPGEHSHILVASGSYPEQVVLKNGVKLHGGYAPDFMQRDIVLFPSVVAPPSPDFSLPSYPLGSVTADGITSETVVSGFTIVGYDVPATALAAGRPTYAVYASASSQALSMVNNWISGGHGGQGGFGKTGSAGTNGGSGSPGKHSAECINGVTCNGPGCNQTSCAGHVQPGGPGGQNATCAAGTSGCPGMEAEGNESTQVADFPPPGCSYKSGGIKATYMSGPVELCKYDCYVSGSMLGPDGAWGGAGTSGTPGSGCADSFGKVVGGQWAAGTAGAGIAGSSGAGGQGGSSGAFVSNSKSKSCSVGTLAGDLGGSGGGGGAGGCGGGGGSPGQPGGASLAVFLPSGAGGTMPVVAGNFIVRGIGGPGGNGGNGGSGGKGGSGGLGGTSGWPAWCAGTGGAGGRGGDGGSGGGAGGGCGGPSVGIAVVGASTQVYSNANSFEISDAVATGGEPGQGGASPDPAKNGTPGVAGGSQNVRGF